MTPNADNAMARFLFAILKQKNLKDIDWNLVAQDPVLLQPITNGHAARMRYSRFRSTILGHEPQKRRSSGDKPRVAKHRKDSHTHIKREPMIKSESGLDLSSISQFSPSVSPYMGDLGDDFDNPRFLTPCSDDMQQSLSMHQAAVQNQTYGIEAPDYLKQEQGMCSPDFSTFEAAYDLSGFTDGTFDLHSQDASDLSATQSLIDCGNDWTDRLHDTQF